MDEQHLARAGELDRKITEPADERLGRDAGAGEPFQAGPGGERPEAPVRGGQNLAHAVVVGVAELRVVLDLERGGQRDNGHVGPVPVEQRDALAQVVVALPEGERPFRQLERTRDEPRMLGAGAQGFHEWRGKEVLVDVEGPHA